MATSSNASFDFSYSMIDDLNRPAAMSAFIVLGSLQSGPGVAQMRKRSAHVGLIRADGLKAHAGNQDYENDTCP